MAVGYFGKSCAAAIRLNAATGAKHEKVPSLKIEGVHPCCGNCVKTVKETLETVPGVTGNAAAKDAKPFEVTGDFNEKDVFAGGAILIEKDTG